MTRVRWPAQLGLWSAVTVIGMACLVLTPHWLLSLALLGFGAVHCWRCGWRWLLIPLLAGVIWAGRYTQWQNLVQPPAASTEPAGVTLLILPSRLKINGDQVSGRAVDQRTGEAVWLSYRLTSAAEKQRLAAAATALTLTGQAAQGPLAAATNPGQFDFARFAAAQYHIGRQVTLTGGEWQLVNGSNNFIYVNQISEAIRLWVARRVAGLPPHTQIYVRGLVLGGGSDTALAQTLRDAQTKLGIIHLWSLSGMQVLLLATALLVVAAWCRIPDEYARWLVFGALLLYGTLADWPTGVTRSVGMFALARLWPRRWALPTLDRLGLVLLIWLWWRPAGITQLGNLLSFLLSFCLFFAPVRFWQQSLVLNLVSMPVILAYQYTWSLLTLGLNIILIPVFNYLAFPVMLLVTLLTIGGWTGSWAGLESVLQAGDALLAQWASLTGGTIVSGALPGWVFAGLLISTLVLAFDRPHWRWGLGAGVVLLGGLCCLRAWPLTDRVAFIDVGQGDSSLVVGRGNGPRVLIDTGGRVTFPRAAWQEQHYAAGITFNVLPVLRYHGIQRLDAVFISHQDADHMGDLPGLLAAIPVRRVYVGAGMAANERLQRAVAQAPQPPIVTELQAGQQVRIRGMTFQAHHPHRPGTGTNEDSLVLTAQIHRRRFLWLGDLDKAGERTILKNPALAAEVIKLGHHGAATSTDHALLAALQPRLGIISAGRNNRYGHPAPATLHTLRQAGVPWLSTAEMGYIEYIGPLWGHDYWHTAMDWSK